MIRRRGFESLPSPLAWRFRQRATCPASELPRIPLPETVWKLLRRGPNLGACEPVISGQEALLRRCAPPTTHARGALWLFSRQLGSVDILNDVVDPASVRVPP